MTSFLQLRIREIIPETPRAKTIVLEPLSSDFRYRPGQFITLLFPQLGAPPLRRSYSMCTTPGIDEWPAITVKKVSNGQASRFLVDLARPGDLLRALPPAGQFTLAANPALQRDLFFFGGGSGITPLYALLRAFLHFEPRSRVCLLYANRNERSIIFRKQLQSLAAAFPDRFHCRHLLSDPADLAGFRETDAPAECRWGRLSNQMVEEWVGRQARYDPARAEFFLCGPKGLMLKTEAALSFLKFRSEQLHKEIFTVKTAYRPHAERFPRSHVYLNWNGAEHHFTVPPGKTILEAAEAEGLTLPYSCRSGICTTCTARCQSGDVEMYTQEGKLDTGMTGGEVLTCVGFPLTEEVRLVQKVND